MRRTVFVSLVLFVSAGLAFAAESNWPQFRGPGGLGIGTGKPPVEFGPEKNVLWKVAVPHGHSSPCIWGGKIFLTGLNNGKLETLCLDRADGHVLWRTAAPADKIEPTHRIGSPASQTPCTDGERLYVYFGSFGLLAYDLDGKELWRKPLPLPIVEFGTGASPILAGGNVIILCDQDMNSFLLAVNARTGKEVWRTDRSEFRRSFSSPFLWKHDGAEEIIVAGSLWVKSYDVKDGRERWFSRGMARVSNASPVAGDGVLIVSSWNVGGDEGDRIAMPPFEQFLAENDKNKDGVLTLDEFPKGPFRDRFSQIDVNKDGRVTHEEYDNMRDMFAKAENQIFAIKPGGHGDITDTHVAWKVNRHLPYVSSPLCANGRAYAVKNGGLASCYDARSGSVIYQAERLDAPGDYYSSAIGADGRIYVASQKGTVVVYDAGDTLRVLARNEMGEQIFATPAVLDGKIYLRTEKHLFAFGR
ncbi:MAG: PQQ-binding-like beta-propeller repeat protein [Verrucomicrobia bacterium]|nr:PQQ-binding-like beta-propeller repeat protein [Verrucomicrobiota bacterium]